jgi:hypothetical protein
MGESILTILARDIKAVRIKCTKCGATQELSLDQLPNYKMTSCLYCDTQIRNDSRPELDPFFTLGKALSAFNARDAVELQFVIQRESAEIQAAPK